MSLRRSGTSIPCFVSFVVPLATIRFGVLLSSRHTVCTKGTRRDSAYASPPILADHRRAGAGFWVAGLGRAAENRSANEKLNIGIIGSAGRGGANLEGVGKENIVALCDVNAKNLGSAAAKYPRAKTYADWRKLVEQKDLNAVVVSTTDHTHAPACVWAMNRGLSVYCEKPLAHSVYEARVVQEKYKASKGKLATQMGTQIHATDNYRRVVELVQGGAVGASAKRHVWCSRVGPTPARPTDTPPCPPELNWDLWLGPAPRRPYHPATCPAA